MEAIKQFLSVSNGFGFGSDYGFGYCFGFGSGSGDGSGYGLDSGSGYGFGYGYGCGGGSGYDGGSGSGCGDGGGGSGSGSTYGSGDGSGDGSGIKMINGNTVYMIDVVPTLIDHVHGNIAKGRILSSDLTLNPCYVVKYGDLFAHGETLREAMRALNEKLFEDMPVEKRIKAFLKAFPGDGKYSVKAFFDWHNRLTGSCEMGRKVFAREHEIDIEHGEMTVDEFIRLTRNAYGGEVIRELEKAREKA